MASFDQFSFLPPELRRMIWKACLPIRVVEVQNNFHLPIAIDCQHTWTTRENSIPPVLMRVCRESRSVALETYVTLAQYRDPPTWLIKGISWRAWFDPKTDILASYFDYVNMFERFEHTFVDASAYYDWFARQGQEGLILADRFLRWSPDADKCAQGLFLPVDTSKGISKRTEYLVALQVLPIHTDLKNALDSQLFGLLGDSPIQIVDPYDTERLQKFLELSNPQDRDVRLFSDMAIDTEGLKKSIDKWSSNLVVAWIWEKWGREIEKAALDIPSPHTVWIGDHWTGLGQYIGMPGATLRPNMDHPWVQQIVNSMPRFRPTLVFRLCVLNCPRLDPYTRSGVFTHPEQMMLANEGWEKAKQDKEAWERGEL
ncbi:hypothetical protein N7457_008715 [Penicillium paradoxum]|uniref:uncharacterized protein n=1 Tax=Penicillium paradoxum TaxID=176176 RepID=UPI00254760A3|nr:uncharacterized protein N7457_008715 [Penicillium paradoxum]KAJ5773819.1 hypothetical protein N7457_008715 [Penicillium paradoxum]